MEMAEIIGDEFRRLQLIQLDMLIEFDALCRRHKIPYTIFGGTLLGAVRHGGYIPWDDDADIAMLREDYERFKRVAGELDHSICYFQDHDTDPEYRWGYGKLRRTGTSFVRAGQEHLKCRTGVFVDVFPLDDVPRQLPLQFLFDRIFFVARKIQWAEVGRLDRSVPRLERIIYKALACIPLSVPFGMIGMAARRSSKASPNPVRILSFTSSGKAYFKHPIRQRYSDPKEWFLHLVDYEFEGVRLLGMRDYDAYLTRLYGDYMKPPEEAAREPHSPVSSYDFGTIRAD